MGRPKPLHERIQLAQQARALVAQGHTQREVASALGVSQPTVCQWLRKHSEDAPTLQALIAYKIRAELVCCDIYERLEQLNAPGNSGEWKRLRHSPEYHDMCHYGEWAARIVEEMQ